MMLVRRGVNGLHKDVIFDDFSMLLVLGVVAGCGSSGLTRVLVVSVVIGVDTLNRMVVQAHSAIRVQSRRAIRN